MLLFCIILFIYLFIFDCSGSSLLCRLFFGCGGWRLLSGCGARVSLVTSGVAEHGLQGARAGYLRRTQLVAPRRVGPSPPGIEPRSPALQADSLPLLIFLGQPPNLPLQSCHPTPNWNLPFCKMLSLIPKLYPFKISPSDMLHSAPAAFKQDRPSQSSQLGSLTLTTHCPDCLTLSTPSFPNSLFSFSPHSLSFLNCFS